MLAALQRVIEYKTNSNTKILANNALSQVTLEPCESVDSQQRLVRLVGAHTSDSKSCQGLTCFN